MIDYVSKNIPMDMSDWSDQWLYYAICAHINILRHLSLGPALSWSFV